VPYFSVRSQSAFAESENVDHGKRFIIMSLSQLSCPSVRFQSALVHGVAEYRNEHFSCCGHPILADNIV
jgi:hypothetical protein